MQRGEAAILVTPAGDLLLNRLGISVGMTSAEDQLLVSGDLEANVIAEGQDRNAADLQLDEGRVKIRQSENYPTSR